MIKHHSNREQTLVPKNPTSHSFRSETSRYGLAGSVDGDNSRTCQETVYCFSLDNVAYLWEYTKDFSLQFEQSTACTQ